MLELIEEAKKESQIISGTDLLDYANELKDQGFNLLANQILAKHYGYLKIDQDKIVDFLSRRWFKLFKNGINNRHAEMLAHWRTYMKDEARVQETLKEALAKGWLPYGLDNRFGIPSKENDFISIFVSRTEAATDQEIKDHGIGWSMNGYIVTRTLNWHERPIATYAKVPPDGIIEKFKICRQRNIFDQYVIADLSVTTLLERIPDPLLLGRIEGSKDRYLIGQWDDDIIVDDLI